MCGWVCPCIRATHTHTHYTPTQKSRERDESAKMRKTLKFAHANYQNGDESKTNANRFDSQNWRSACRLIRFTDGFLFDSLIYCWFPAKTVLKNDWFWIALDWESRWCLPSRYLPTDGELVKVASITTPIFAHSETEFRGWIFVNPRQPPLRMVDGGPVPNRLPFTWRLATGNGRLESLLPLGQVSASKIERAFRMGYVVSLGFSEGWTRQCQWHTYANAVITCAGFWHMAHNVCEHKHTHTQTRTWPGLDSAGLSCAAGIVGAYRCPWRCVEPLLTCCLGTACTSGRPVGGVPWRGVLRGTCAVASWAEKLDNAWVVAAGQLAASFSWPDLPHSQFACAGAAKSRRSASQKAIPPTPKKKNTHQPAPCTLPCSSNAAASAAACKSVCVFVLRPSASSIYKFERILLSTPTLPSAQQTAAAAAATAVAVAAASPFRHPAPAVACPCQTVKFMPRRKE